MRLTTIMKLLMTKSGNIKYYCLFIFFLINFQLLGQTQTETKIRTGVKLKADLFKHLGTSFEIEQRFTAASGFDNFLIEPELNYTISRKIRVGSMYRLTIQQKDAYYLEPKHRLSAYVRLKLGFGDFETKIKSVLQYGSYKNATSFFDYRNKLINRNSFSVDWDIYSSKITPFVEYEFFYHINHPNGGIINEWRISAGSNYQLSKKSELKFYYIYNHEIYRKNPTNSNIWGVGYSVDL